MRKAVSFAQSHPYFLFSVPGLQVTVHVSAAVAVSVSCFCTEFQLLLYIYTCMLSVTVCCLVCILVSGLMFWLSGPGPVSGHLYLFLLSASVPVSSLPLLYISLCISYKPNTMGIRYYICNKNAYDD